MHIDDFQILADPMRRSIVEVLQFGEMSVNDIVTRVHIHQSGVSRHLRILQQAGFVTVRPEGQKRFYALAPEPFIRLDNWLQDIRKIWEPRLERFEQALIQKQLRHREKGETK